MAASSFYDAGLVKQVAVNFFYGWGYNFYRQENQLRADDQLVRSKASWLLGLARDSVVKAEADYRRDHIPAPTRAQPFPDPQVLALARGLERLAAEIGAAEARLHSLPAPENDRMSQRYRSEVETLARLVECDEQMIGQSEMLRAMVDGQPAEWLAEHQSEIEGGLAAITKNLQNRASILLDPA